MGGKPPVGPWGNVPGLPPETETARTVVHRFDLPPGTSRVSVPEWAAAAKLAVAGRVLDADDGVVDLGAIPPRERTVAALIITGGKAEAPLIQCDCGAHTSSSANSGPFKSVSTLVLKRSPVESATATSASRVGLPTVSAILLPSAERLPICWSIRPRV